MATSVFAKYPKPEQIGNGEGFQSGHSSSQRAFSYTVFFQRFFANRSAI